MFIINATELVSTRGSFVLILPFIKGSFIFSIFCTLFVDSFKKNYCFVFQWDYTVARWTYDEGVINDDDDDDIGVLNRQASKSKSSLASSDVKRLKFCKKTSS
jgi:hypothetical protein